MWDFIKDYSLWFGLMAFGTWPLLAEVRKGGSIWPKLIVCIAVVVLSVLGCDQNQRAIREKNEASNEIKRLTEGMDSVSSILIRTSEENRTNHVKDSLFEKKLYEEFKIIRDSIHNKPISATYNTYIKKAEQVNIGNK